MEIEDPNYKEILKMSSYQAKQIFANAVEKVDLDFVQDNIFYDINYSIMTNAKLDHIIDYNKYMFQKKKIQSVERRNQRTTSLKFKNQPTIIPVNSFNENIEKKIKELDDKILKCQIAIKNDDKFNIRIKEIYITLRNLKIAHFYNNAYKKNKCTRCCLIFCCEYKKIQHL
jgi:hypothetical protein